MQIFRKRPSQSLSTIVRFGIGVAVVIVLVRNTDVNFGMFAGPQVLFGTVAAVLLLGVALGLSALRWKLVLGRDSPSLLDLWRVYAIGWFFSLFLPTSVGGDAVRATAISRSSTGIGGALSSILLERLIGVAALGAYLLLGLIIAPAVLSEALAHSSFETPARHVGLVIAGLAVAGTVVLFLLRRRIAQVGIVQEAARLLDGFRKAPARMSGALFVSLLVQAVYIVVWVLLAWSFVVPAPPVAFLVYVPFISLAAMLPITLGGLGVREGAWALLLSAHGVAAGDAVAFSLAYYLAGLILGGVGGAAFGIWGLRVDGNQPVASLESMPDRQVATIADG